jgi:hypothetical protein
MSEVSLPGVALLSEVRSIRSADRIQFSLHTVDLIAKVPVIHRSESLQPSLEQSNIGVSAGKRIPARATQPLRVSSLTPGGSLSL